MSHPVGRDYGEEDSKTLVPGSLTVFRHFLINTDTQHITPMSWTPRSYQTYLSSRSPSHRPYRPSWDGDPVVHQAECTKQGMSSGFDAMMAQRGMTHPKSPTEWCTCGFYAHYDPATDFYPSYRWGRQYARVSGQHELSSVVVVRAVVEVSGTCVMGRLGVRAEKLKIIALAIDWDKQIKPQATTRVAPFPRDFFSSLGIDDVFYEHHDDYAEDDDNALTENRVASVAHHHRVRFYTDVDKMYEDHPPADISALGVDTTPRPESEFSFSFTTTALTYQQANLYGRQVSQAAKAMAPAVQGAAQSMRAWYDEMVKAVEDPPGPVNLTPFERAMDAKRRRPAPPGAGIDRRRGKLR